MKKPASRLVHPPAERILPQRFWSSDKLTGSQTSTIRIFSVIQFWSSDKLMDIVFVGNVVIVHVYLVLFCLV